MPTNVFLLVCIAAVCHASWNFAARRIAGNMLIVWLGLWAGCLVMLPVALLIVLQHGLAESVPTAGVNSIIATGVIHAAYFSLLALAYESGELSLVYPVARGSGVGFTAIFGVLLLGERISVLGLSGIILIVLGTLVLGAPSLLHRQRHTIRAFALALGVGATIVGYSLVDKVGVGHVHPIAYIWLMFLTSALVMSPLVLWRYRGRYRESIRGRVRYAFLIGIGSLLTYLLILFAFQDEAVSYVVAAREFAIVVGAMLGFAFLRERMTPFKVLAIAAITIGTCCMKYG